MEFEKTVQTISLHGLGFLQIKLGGNQRLHVWHPDLPRRKCFKYSAIHDHRFGFESRILVGTQLNEIYGVYEPSRHINPTHVAYLHEGQRRPSGNRPWIAREKLWVGHVSSQLVEAGETYIMLKHVFHKTLPGGDGRVATIMTKVDEDDVGARSLCEISIQPDNDFDRFQMSGHDMWSIVCDVLGGMIGDAL